MEFGTTNELTILLQRNGFSRESATYIKQHQADYVETDGSTGELKLRSSLLQCGNTSVMTEAADIKYNVPGLFIDDECENGDEAGSVFCIFNVSPVLNPDSDMYSWNWGHFKCEEYFFTIKT